MATLAQEHEDVLQQLRNLRSARWSASSILIDSTLTTIGPSVVYQPKGNPSTLLMYHGQPPAAELPLLVLATPCVQCSSAGRTVYHGPGRCV
jgi:hypothetical protein